MTDKKPSEDLIIIYIIQSLKMLNFIVSKNIYIKHSSYVGQFGNILPKHVRKYICKTIFTYLPPSMG